MRIKYVATAPDGRQMESLNREDLPQDWVITEVEMEDINYEEIRRLKEIEITEIFNARITILCANSVENFIFDGTPIPQEIRDQRDLIIEEKNQRISEIDVSTMGKNSIQNTKK